MVRINSRAPVRISFAGGGTDVSPYFDKHGGCVISAGITQYAWGSLKTRHDDEICIESLDYFKKMRYKNIKAIKYDHHLDLIKSVVKRMDVEHRGVDVFLRSDVPPRTGLGSSAAAFVAMIGCFNRLHNNKMDNYEVADLAYKLEREDLKNLGGKQDQYACAFGGLNFIEFEKDGTTIVNEIKIKKDYIQELEKNLILAHVGPRTVSGDILKDQIARYKKKQKSVMHALSMAKDIAREMRGVLTRGDLHAFGDLLDKAWFIKKKLTPYMTTPAIDKLYELAKKEGAIGGKITGAGGGGYMLLYCDTNKEQKVANALKKKGAVIMPFLFDMKGLQTWEVKE